MSTIGIFIAVLALGIAVMALWMIGSLGEKIKAESSENLDRYKVQTDIGFQETDSRLFQSDNRIKELSKQINVVEARLQNLANQPDVAADKISTLEEDVAELRLHLHSLEQGLPQNLRVRRSSQPPSAAH
jgi:chromosome segregation ATPase